MFFTTYVLRGSAFAVYSYVPVKCGNTLLNIINFQDHSKFLQMQQRILESVELH